MNGVRRGEFGHCNSVNAIEPTRFMASRVTEENVFAVPLRFSFTLNFREVRCDLEESRGVTSMGEQHPCEHDGDFHILTWEISMRSQILAIVALLGLTNVIQADDKVTANDLKQLGLAYHNFLDVSKGKSAPVKAEDLEPFLDQKVREKILGFLKSGQIVFIYNVRIAEMIMGTSNTLIAYEKNTPEGGGPVLYGDGSVKTLTADKFDPASVAKPLKKN
jgi:hypothetical protein